MMLYIWLTRSQGIIIDLQWAYISSSKDGALEIWLLRSQGIIVIDLQWDYISSSDDSTLHMAH